MIERLSNHTPTRRDMYPTGLPRSRICEAGEHQKICDSKSRSQPSRRHRYIIHSGIHFFARTELYGCLQKLEKPLASTNPRALMESNAEDSGIKCRNLPCHRGSDMRAVALPRRSPGKSYPPYTNPVCR